MRFTKSHGDTIHLILILLTAMISMSCVHEFPEPPATRPVTLTITHEDTWDYYEHSISRSGVDISLTARYHIIVTPAGLNAPVLLDKEIYASASDVTSVTTALDIPDGRYDIRVWRDIADPMTVGGLYYDSKDFNAIRYKYPYVGNDKNRDIFCGHTTIAIERDIYAKPVDMVEITLSRPIASYSFIATDLSEFKVREGRDMSQYRALMYYTGYMPDTYDHFRERPINSATGVSYEGELRVLDDNEVLLAYDHVLVNGNESTVSVMFELHDADDAVISRSSVVSVPIVRNRHTIVRGRFLTSRANAGVGINPDFDGDYNIEIR